MIRKLEPGEPIAVLLASWKYVILGLVVGTALGALYHQVKPVLYETYGIVVVIKPNMTNGEFSLPDTMLQESFLPFFSAHSLLEETQRQFDLGKNYPPHVLKNLVKVEPLRKSNLLRIQLTFEDAELAERIARFIIDEGVKKHETVRVHRQEQTASALRDQVQIHSDFVHTTETELIDLITDNRIPVLNKQLEALQQLIVKLEFETQLNALEIEKLSAKANSIEASLEKQDTVFLTRSVLADEDDLRHGIARQGDVSDSELANMEVSREILNDAYVNSLELQVKTLSDLEGLRARQAGAQKKLNDTLKRTDEIINLVWPMNIERQRLLKKLETARTVMKEARLKYERGATLVSQRSQSMELLEPPFVPDKPSGPGLLMLIAAGGIAGFGGALTLILLASRSGDLLSPLKSSDSPDHRESGQAGD